MTDLKDSTVPRFEDGRYRHFVTPAQLRAMKETPEGRALLGLPPEEAEPSVICFGHYNVKVIDQNLIEYEWVPA